MRLKVLAICTAYEQGYGHGCERRKADNPYQPDSDEWQAWDYGYSEGNKSWIVKSMRAVSEAALRRADEALSGGK